MAAKPVLLSPLVYQLTSFVQGSVLDMIHHLFMSYGVIDKNNLKEYPLKTMGPYDHVEPLAV